MCSEDMSLCSEDMSLCSEDNNCYIHAQPIIDVIWRGGFYICNGDANGKVQGLRAHLSNKACSKVWDAAVKIPTLISVEIVPRLDVWPRHYSNSPPTDESIAIYIFPENESHEQVFNKLLDDIICGDCALISVLGVSQLLLFTSLQLPMEHQRFQGKIYLWGVFKGKSSQSSYLSNDHLSVQSASVNLAAAAVESSAICAEGINNGVPMPTKEMNTDIDWENVKCGEKEGKQLATCNYCNHAYAGKLGIARLKHHLAGGYPKWRIKGCPKVQKEVEESMKEPLKVTMKELIELGVSKEPKDGKSWNSLYQRNWYARLTPQERSKHIKEKIAQRKRKRQSDVASTSHHVNDNLEMVTSQPPTKEDERSSNRAKQRNWYARLTSEKRAKLIEKKVLKKKSKQHSSSAKTLTSCNLTEKGVPIPTKEMNSDIVWEHAKCGEKEGKQVASCNYCNHVYAGKIGIARLKHHLAGGYPKWHIKGCPKVPMEVEEAMKETLKVTMKKLVELGVSEELKDGKSLKSLHQRSWYARLTPQERSRHIKEKMAQRKRKRQSDVASTPHHVNNYLEMVTSQPPTKEDPCGGTRTQVKPRCKCCVSSKSTPKRRNLSISSAAVTTLKTNFDEEICCQNTHGCQNEQSEVRHVREEEPNNDVVTKDKKGIVTTNFTSNQLEGGNAVNGIQLGEKTIAALPHLLIRNHSKQPPAKVSEPQTFAPENTPNSTSTPVVASRLSIPDLQVQVLFTPSTVSASGGKARQIRTTNLAQGDDTIRPLPLQHPELPTEKIIEPQILAPGNAQNTTFTPVVASTLSVPDIQLESVVSAQNSGDRASLLGTTIVPEGDHSGVMSNNYELSDQTADSSFLHIVKALNELAEPTGTDSELSSVMQVGQYTVKHDLGKTLEAIFEKYGDIAQNCPIQCSSIRSRFLGELCEVLHQLKDVGFSGCRSHHLKSLLAAVTTAKNAGLDVSWLDQRYDDLKTTLMWIRKYSDLESDLAQTKAQADSRKETLDSKKDDMMRLQSEMEAMKGQLASLRAENTDLESKMSNVRLKAKRFHHKNLADGLL